MRKLQLIKPWKLKTVRVRLDAQVDFAGVDTRSNIPCCGPAGDDPSRAESSTLNIRCNANTTLRNSYTAKAPVSGLIFASLYDNRIR
jgi:hypothetical protein